MLKSDQLILRVYMSVSVSTWGHRLFGFHLWDDLRRLGNTMCGYMGPFAQWQLDNHLRRPSQRLRAAHSRSWTRSNRRDLCNRDPEKLILARAERELRWGTCPGAGSHVQLQCMIMP